MYKTAEASVPSRLPGKQPFLSRKATSLMTALSYSGPTTSAR